jgi:hypothetical protein
LASSARLTMVVTAVSPLLLPTTSSDAISHPPLLDPLSPPGSRARTAPARRRGGGGGCGPGGFAAAAAAARGGRAGVRQGRQVVGERDETIGGGGY